MFSQQKKTVNKTVKKEHTRDFAVTILTSGCHFSGKLYCKGSTRIGGRIDGEIISEGLLILEEGATVCADIRADEIVVQGKVEGTVVAKSRVELSASCSFNGDIASPSLVIEEGACFNGRSNMESRLKGKDNAPLKLEDGSHVKKPKMNDVQVNEVSVLGRNEVNVKAK